MVVLSPHLLQFLITLLNGIERVLNRIRNLECSAEFTEHNFVLSEYTDASGRKLPATKSPATVLRFLPWASLANVQPGSKRHTSTPLTRWRRIYLVLTRLICQLLHETPEAYTCICVKSIKSGKASFTPCLRPLNLRWRASCMTV